VLTQVEARVLGCLIEKQLTTPDLYPLTLKALTSACNQTSNRDPVMELDPHQVETTALVLKTKGLLRVVHPGSGERSTRYRQVADDALTLEPDERAVLCALLLRGAQTVSELRTRTERMHAFDGSNVEQALDRLARRQEPLTQVLEVRPGQREARWIDLLQDEPHVPEPPAGAGGGARDRPPGLAEQARAERLTELEARVEALEQQVARLLDALGD
jgi:uncharacterized protein YceH (UPF0502 family)